MGWGGGGGDGRKRRALLFLLAPRFRVSSHVPLVRVLFTISPNGKLAFMLVCSTMLKKIENHDCAFVVSNLYFKLICTSRSCFMTRNLRDSSPFRVAIDARRKKTHEKASILKRVEERPAPRKLWRNFLLARDINLNGKLLFQVT